MDEFVEASLPKKAKVAWFWKKRDSNCCLPKQPLNILALIELGSIRRKHIIRWQHLSRIKARLLWRVEKVFFPIKTQQGTSVTSAATFELMEPQSTIGIFRLLGYQSKLNWNLRSVSTWTITANDVKSKLQTERVCLQRSLREGCLKFSPGTIMMMFPCCPADVLGACWMAVVPLASCKNESCDLAEVLVA